MLTPGCHCNPRTIFLSLSLGLFSEVDDVVARVAKGLMRMHCLRVIGHINAKDMQEICYAVLAWILSCSSTLLPFAKT